MKLALSFLLAFSSTSPVLNTRLLYYLLHSLDPYQTELITHLNHAEIRSTLAGGNPQFHQHTPRNTSLDQIKEEVKGWLLFVQVCLYRIYFLIATPLVLTHS